MWACLSRVCDRHPESVHHVHDEVSRQHQQGGESVAQLVGCDWRIKLSSEDVDSTAVIPHSLTHTPKKRPVVPAMGQHLQNTHQQYLHIHSQIFNLIRMNLISKRGQSCVLNIVFLHWSECVAACRSACTVPWPFWDVQQLYQITQNSVCARQTSSAAAAAAAAAAGLFLPPRCSALIKSHQRGPLEKKKRLFFLWCSCLKHPSHLPLTVGRLFACSQIIPKRRGGSL